MRYSAKLSWSELVRTCQCIAVQFSDIYLDFAAILRGLRIFLEQEASFQSLKSYRLVANAVSVKQFFDNTCTLSLCQGAQVDSRSLAR